MGLTRGNLFDRVTQLLGDVGSSSNLRTYLAASLNNMLYAFYDLHDWNFKHQQGTFPTVVNQEEYDLSVSTSSIRSSQDVEVLYNTTLGRFLRKVDLRDIRKAYPMENQFSEPTHYAPWGAKTIFLHPKPTSVDTFKYLYLSLPTESTSDNDNLDTVCGVPVYVQYLFEKMVLAEGMQYYDDDRRAALLQEIQQVWLPMAINADMKHLEDSARFKFWEEELSFTGHTYDDFLRQSWWGGPQGRY